MMPMTMPAMPGTSIELDDSMDVRMKARVPSARLSIVTGASDWTENAALGLCMNSA